jgi:hypothetical protein
VNERNFFSELKRRNVYKVAMRGDPRFQKLASTAPNTADK